MRSAEPLSVALDLGSTRFKSASLDGNGALTRLDALPTPKLHGSGEIREADARTYLAAATRLLERARRGRPARLPLGLASQRSTLVVWDSAGVPLTPLISWQDRRASSWCARHESVSEELTRTTGLVLSGHYAGPKLAHLLESDSDLRKRMRSGDAFFGTLDCFVLWHWTGGAAHEIDGTMAARTAMLDLQTGDWASALLDIYGVPERGLPQVVPTAGRELALDQGVRVTATVADQAAGALSTLEPDDDAALVNLGTGAFVLRPARGAGDRIEGYLTAPVLAGAEGRGRFVIEGAINGAGTAIDRYGEGPTSLPDLDPHPRAFALPDAAGVGSPYWIPDVGPLLSDDALNLPESEARRVALEGLLFRVREVLDEVSSGSAPARVFLSGGLAREAALAAGLATLLDRRVEVLEASESVLTGTARLAAGLPPGAEPVARAVDPGSAGAYLPDKYFRWRDWLSRALDR